MKLSVPVLGQRDGRWNRKTLGNSSTTIGSYGCLLVCHTMLLNYYGKDFTPDTLNAVYKEKGVFSGNLINFWKAGKVFPDITADEYYNCKTTSCDLSKIDKYLKERKPVIAWVDNVNNDKRPDHFILIIGKTDDGHYIINDPWTGETYFFNAKYGEPSKEIYGLRLYSGTPPNNGKSVEDELRETKESLKSANEMLADKSLEVNSLRDALDSVKTKVEGLEVELNKTRGERDTAVWEKDKASITIKKMEEENDKLKQKSAELKEKITKLEEKIKELQKQKLSAINDSGVYAEALRRILRAVKLRR